MTCNCIWGTEIAFEITEQKYNIVYAQKCFYVISEFYSFLHQGWANFSVAKNLILQKIVSGVDKVVNFEDFSIPNKEINYFSRTLTEFKDFQDDY